MITGHTGLFISLEGIEGAGKSTHTSYIAELLQQDGRQVIVTREPGGTVLGEQIRNLLLQHNTLNISATSELLLMFAARVQHISEIIRPALAQGKIVICDRFTDSSYAYQGGGRGIATEHICTLNDIIHADLKPDLTLLFDVQVTTGLERAKKASAADRFESESMEFFTAVRAAYLKIAAAEPERVKIINAEQNIDAVQTEIKRLMKNLGLC
jgi:dTMP kinase